MIKLNFDGASKGNPGNSGFGEIFRNHQGVPLLSFFGSKGWDTNNSAELEGLWQGLIIAQDKGFFPLIIEGDSQIIINMVSKIMQGTPSHKVSKSWRMEKRIELIAIWLSRHKAIYIKHTRWEGNKVADFLANLGVECRLELHIGSFSSLVSASQLMNYNNIMKNDRYQSEDTHQDAGALKVY